MHFTPQCGIFWLSAKSLLGLHHPQQEKLLLTWDSAMGLQGSGREGKGTSRESSSLMAGGALAEDANGCQGGW